MVSYMEQTTGTMFLKFLAVLLCFLMVKFTNVSLEEHIEKIKYYILEIPQKNKDIFMMAVVGHKNSCGTKVFQYKSRSFKKMRWLHLPELNTGY